MISPPPPRTWRQSYTPNGQNGRANALRELAEWISDHRNDDALIDALAGDGVAYVPFFPLGGFSPLQSSKLDDVATELGATPMQVALVWLLRRSPNILLIPGTSSVAHLRDNIAAASLELSDEAMQALDGIGR